jgi:hypothetical protein
MGSEKEQKGDLYNPFVNPIDFWQNYLINWIEASKAFYENAIKGNQHWFEVFYDLWLRATSLERKETAKVE